MSPVRPGAIPHGLRAGHACPNARRDAVVKMTDGHVSDRAEGLPSRASQPIGHVVMFWGLLMMAGATFGACVLVPILAEYEQLSEQLIDTQRETAALEAELQRTRKTIEAIRTDPAAAEQIAKIGLNYRRSGERKVTVLSELEVAVLGTEAAPAPDVPPLAKKPATRLHHGLAALPWRSLFCEPTSRLVLLITSGGMILLAFGLYDGRRGSAR